MTGGSTKELNRRVSITNGELTEISLDFQIKLMRIIGLLPFEDSKLAGKLYPYYKLFTLVVVLIHLITMIIATIHQWGDFVNIVMTVSMVLSYIEVTFKIVDTYLYGDKIERLISTLLEDFSNVHILYGKEQSKAMEESMGLNKKVCNVYLVFGFAAGGMWCAEPMVDMALHRLLHPDEEHEWALPFAAVFPFDQHATPFYQAAFLFQAVVIFVGVAVTVAADVMFISLMVFTAGHLRALGKSLEGIRMKEASRPPPFAHWMAQLEDGSSSSEAVLEARQRVYDEEAYKSLIACIKHHKSIISFASELEKIISPVMFFQFLATTLEICLAGFQAKLGNTMSPSFFKFMLYTASNIIQTFCYCKFGDNIVVESTNFAMSTYNSEWYEGSERFKKSMRILLLRSEKPIRLWAGKFYAVSLETFSNLMHHSYSFFTLLSQMHE